MCQPPDSRTTTFTVRMPYPWRGFGWRVSCPHCGVTRTVPKSCKAVQASVTQFSRACSSNVSDILVPCDYIEFFISLSSCSQCSCLRFGAEYLSRCIFISDNTRACHGRSTNNNVSLILRLLGRYCPRSRQSELSSPNKFEKLLRWNHCAVREVTGSEYYCWH